MTLGVLKPYVATLLRAFPGRVGLIVVLGGLVALAEASAVLLLVPILGALGVEVEGGTAGALYRRVVGAVEFLGLEPGLRSALALFVALAVLRSALARWHGVAAVGLQVRFAAFLREDLYRKILRADWVFLARIRTTDLAHLLTEEAERVGSGTQAFLSLAMEGLLLAAYLGIAARLSPVMAVAVGACGAVFVLLLRRRVREAGAIGQAWSEDAGAYYRTVGEHLGGLKTIKGYGAEDSSAVLFEQASRAVARVHDRASRNHADTKWLFDVGTAGLLAAVLLVAIEGLRLPAGSAVLFLVVFMRTMPRVSLLQQLAQGFLNILPAFEGIRRMGAACDAASELRPGPSRPLAPTREISLQDVSFAYAREDGRADVLSRVSLTIRVGETTAIVGPSGSGKSTVADLLLGLIAPMSGRLLVDGGPVPAGEAAGWCRQVGYVAQEAFLFHDTIRANLLWARPDATESDLWDVLREAAAADFVARLPDGLDAVVGDRGARLSGGERQRIALARALLRKPPLLILDEPASALDAENEQRVLQAVERLRGRVTIVLITHRLHAAAGADAIYVLDGGRVAEWGTWDDLLRKSGGRLRSLCEAQGVPAGRSGVYAS